MSERFDKLVRLPKALFQLRRDDECEARAKPPGHRLLCHLTVEMDGV